MADNYSELSSVSLYSSQITLYNSLYTLWQSILKLTILEIPYLGSLLKIASAGKGLEYCVKVSDVAGLSIEI